MEQVAIQQQRAVQRFGGGFGIPHLSVGRGFEKMQNAVGGISLDGLLQQRQSPFGIVPVQQPLGFPFGLGRALRRLGGLAFAHRQVVADGSLQGQVSGLLRGARHGLKDVQGLGIFFCLHQSECLGELAFERLGQDGSGSRA